MNNVYMYIVENRGGGGVLNKSLIDDKSPGTSWAEGRLLRQKRC